jgi:hypothetical protein
MNKQTAVEFLEDNLSQVLDWDLLELFQQAKEMEKEQIMDAIESTQNGLDRLEQEESGIRWAEDYYNKTYGGDQ